MCMFMPLSVHFVLDIKLNILLEIINENNMNMIKLLALLEIKRLYYLNRLFNYSHGYLQSHNQSLSLFEWGKVLRYFLSLCAVQ